MAHPCERVQVYRLPEYQGTPRWHWECKDSHCVAPTYEQHGLWRTWGNAIADAIRHTTKYHPKKHLTHDV